MKARIPEPVLTPEQEKKQEEVNEKNNRSFLNYAHRNMLMAAQTKGQNLEWSTPTMILRAMGAYIDNSDKLKFRDRKSFDTYAAAKAFIDDYANISSSAVTGG